MIKDGKGGANTKTGLEFEKRVDLRTAFSELKDYEIHDENDLYYKGKIVAQFYKKYGLYSGLLKNHKIEWSKILSKKLLPDETVYIPSRKKLYVIEMKFQHTPGSVDEKLQTCAFKLLQYNKLLKPAGISVSYIYILGDWFKRKEYKDTLNYIVSVGCDYYFEKLPLKVLGLPVPK